MNNSVCFWGFPVYGFPFWWEGVRNLTYVVWALRVTSPTGFMERLEFKAIK